MIEYQIWNSMWRRCTTPNHISYKRYGGAGVTVCARWKKFRAFYEDMGPRPSPQHTIDRKDGAKGYEPGNCRWATRAEQSKNRHNAVYVEFKGARYWLPELAAEHQMPLHHVYGRIFKMGWPVEKAITTPINKHKNPRKPKAA